MGFNTAILMLNDALGDLRDDPDVGVKLYDAVTRTTRGQPVVVHLGCHGNAATVIPSQHASLNQVIVVGGNTIQRLATTSDDVDSPEKLMRFLAQSLGYTVSRRRQSRRPG